MTAFDNMAFGLKLRKVAKDDIRNRVADAAKLLGIGDFVFITAPIVPKLKNPAIGGKGIKNGKVDFTL
jgi:hypothetical protein